MPIDNNFKDLPTGMFPRQKLKSSKKNEDWWKACVNAIIKISSDSKQPGRSSRKDKLENYDLMNSKIKQENFLHLTDRYGLSDKENNMPVQMFNIVRSKVERLKGEEMQRRFGFQVVGVDGEVVQIRTDERKKVIREYLQQQLQAALGEPQVDQQGNPIPQPELERVIKDFDKNWEDIREKWVNKILHYLKRRESLELKFNEGWEHALIGSEEIYRIGILKGEPHVRVANPINIWFDVVPHMNKVQDSEKLVERRIMSKSEILDEFGDLFSEKELNLIDSDDYNDLLNSVKFPNRSSGLFSMGRPQGDVGYELEAILNEGWNDDPYINEATFKRGQFAVYSCVWKSWKKIGWLTYIDENGESQSQQVDDTFKLEEEQEAAGWSVEWSWIIEVWEGHKIPGLNLYFGGQAVENQVDGELPYVGRIYNGTNTEPVSLVGLIKDYQHIHSMTWHKIKEEIAKAKGKKLKMDVAQIPKSQGMDIDTILHYFDKMDVMFYNSMEEGREGDPSSVARANQSDSFDMGISSTFTALMSVLKEIEYGVDSITGISKQREGDIAASETATNAGRAIVQSTYITESLFYTHNQCKIEVLTHLVEVAQMAYKNGKSGQFIMDDGIRAILDIDGDLLNDSKFKLFITGSPADSQVLESIKGLAQIAIQSDKANLSELIKLYKATSIAEAETEIIAGEQDKIARDQAAQENANNMEIQREQIISQRQKEAEDREDARAALERENRLNIARISQLGLNDTNNNSVPDILEVENLKFKNSQHDKEMVLEREKLAQAKLISDRDAKLKEKEIAVKKIAANKKPSSKK